MNKVVCTSGYFNPLHKGHLALFREASKMGTFLVVIVNNDEQVKLKGSKDFMSQSERAEIVEAIRYVDKVQISIDDDKTICKTLEMLKPNIFVKGGDSTPDNTPEIEACKKLGIEVWFNVGGSKVQSSSWLKR